MANIKIKLFKAKTPKIEDIEIEVNSFLKENSEAITVRDIKYTAVSPNPNNTAWTEWTVMVVYETDAE